MSLGYWQIIIIALVVLVLFGRGRISEMMGDFGKGIKSFKQGIKDEDDGGDNANANASASSPPAQIEPPANQASAGQDAGGQPSNGAADKAGQSREGGA